MFFRKCKILFLVRKFAIVGCRICFFSNQFLHYFLNKCYPLTKFQYLVNHADLPWSVLLVLHPNTHFSPQSGLVRLPSSWFASLSMSLASPLFLNNFVLFFFLHALIILNRRNSLFLLYEEVHLVIKIRVKAVWSIVGCGEKF